MNDEFRPLGPGRYAMTLKLPWGQEVPAEMILATRKGWHERPEARDGRWSAFSVGPVVIALRLTGELLTAPAPPLPRSPVPAEWN